MIIKAKESLITGRIERIALTAESFADEKILGIIAIGLANENVLFTLTDGESQVGSFHFNQHVEEPK